MKKIALGVAGLVLLVVLAGLGSSFYFSRQAEAKAAEWPDKIRELAPYAKVDADYRRGLLTSTQVINISIPQISGEHGLVIKNVIHHGPFPGFAGMGMATVEHSLDFDPAIQQQLAKVFGGSAPFTATTTIGLDGTGTMEIHGAPASFAEGGMKVAWQGLGGTLHFTKGLDSYSGEITAPLFSAITPNGSADMKNLSLKMDSHRMPGFEEIYLGTTRFSLESLAFKGGESEGKMEKALMEAEASSADNQFLDMKANFKVAKVAATDFEAADADYAFSMRHIHAQSFMEIIKAIRESTPKSGMLKPDPAATQAQMEALQKIMKTHGLVLLKNNPVITIDRLNVKLKEGEIKASGSVKLPGVTEADAAQPLALIAKVDAEATLSLPEAFVRNQYAQNKVRSFKAQQADLTEAQIAQINAGAEGEFTQVLTAFGQQGYVESEGAALKTTLAFKGGVFTVNGKPFNPMGPPPTTPPAAPAIPPQTMAPPGRAPGQK